MGIAIGGINYSIKSPKTVYIGTGKAVGEGEQGDGVYNKDLISPNLVINSTIIHNNRKYTVTGLNNHAFACSSWLKSVTIPRTINHIGYSCFWKCSNIESVTFVPGISIKDFPTKLFDITKITHLEIPESVVTFQNQALYGNTALENITYCGSGFIAANVITGSSLKNIFVTPKYNHSTINGMTPTVRYDYICPTIIYLDKLRFRCSKVCRYHISHIYYCIMLSSK